MGKFQNKVKREKTKNTKKKNVGSMQAEEVINSILSEPFNGMDIGINVVPKQSFSDPVGQIKGFPTMLQ